MKNGPAVVKWYGYSFKGSYSFILLFAYLLKGEKLLEDFAPTGAVICV